MTIAEPTYPPVTTSDFLVQMVVNPPSVDTPDGTGVSVDPSGPWFYRIDKISKSGQTVWLEPVGAHRYDGAPGWRPGYGNHDRPIVRKRLNRIAGLTFVSLDKESIAVLWGGRPM